MGSLIKSESELQKQSRPKSLWDYLGIALSSLCIAHCVLVPFALMAFPLLGSYFLPTGNPLHSYLFFSVLLVAVLASYFGYRIHYSPSPFLWMCFGLVFILLGTFFSQPIVDFFVGLGTHDHQHAGDLMSPYSLVEAALMTLGGVLLIRAHWLNHSKMHLSEHQDCGGCHSTTSRHS